ncbi:hypothetical protein P8C59_006493 [Phyllachora maydis]|uniref:Uncharacterized protein n=1 Tax=Phyllachora maydis TaxID=1825666 RepID=A0AAD9I8C2_9PEZI|nr:hypothetical protein P8C59_006493 [Phyllachora maydis]
MFALVLVLRALIVLDITSPMLQAAKPQLARAVLAATPDGFATDVALWAEVRWHSSVLQTLQAVQRAVLGMWRRIPGLPPQKVLVVAPYGSRVVLESRRPGVGYY